MLGAAGLISEALEQLNVATEGDLEEIELDLEKLGSTLEAALTFLGNTSTQTSNLRRLKLMEDINKDMVPYTMDQEEHFTAQAPMLFGNEFMKNATEHWEQVKALQKMCNHPSTSGFQKVYSQPGKKKITVWRDTLQQGGTRCTKGAEMTVNWGRRPQILCCKSHVFVKSIKCKKPYVVEGTSNGSITTRGDITFGGGKVGNVYRRLEGVNRRPLGLASSQRVQNSLCLLTQPGYNANKSVFSDA